MKKYIDDKLRAQQQKKKYIRKPQKKQQKKEIIIRRKPVIEYEDEPFSPTEASNSYVGYEPIERRPVRPSSLLERTFYDKNKGKIVVERKGAKPRRPLKPWEDANADPRILRAFNLRFTEPDYLKMRYVVKNSNFKSMHEFCMTVVMEFINGILEQMDSEF